MKQGWGLITAGPGEPLVTVVEGVPAACVFEMEDGPAITGVMDGWGRDFGEEWPHLYLLAETGEMHLVNASRITEVRDPSDGRQLYRRA